jgi:cytochrome c556
MKKFLSASLVIVCVLAVSVVASAQAKKGKTRAASTKQVMSGLVQPNCAALGKGAKDAPADDKAWEALATNAALLNEASYLLMDDGRCPDAEWANAAKALRAGTEAVLAKIAAKDQAGVATEFKAVTQACAACHKAHKK